VVLVVIVFFANLACVIDPAVGVPAPLWVPSFFLLRVSDQHPDVCLVLAIGIVVDDAIVVVENVERNIEAEPARRDRQGHARSLRAGSSRLPSCSAPCLCHYFRAHRRASFMYKSSPSPLPSAR
jgi:Cu/Ag efflux pump CusA